MSLSELRDLCMTHRLGPCSTKCEGKKKEVCLYYHIGECIGFCQKQINKNELELIEKDIIVFVGNSRKSEYVLR